MKILEIDPLKDPRWDDLVQSCPASSIYHSSAWFRVISGSYNYEPYYLVLENDRNEIVAGFPAVRVSSRYTGTRIIGLSLSDYADIVARDGIDREDFLQEVLRYLEEKQALPLEISCRDTCQLDLHMPVIRQTWNHILSLEDSMEELSRVFTSKTRQNVNIAEKKGLSVEVACRLEDMKEFYTLYVATRKRKGLLPQPFIFFRLIHEVYHQNNLLDLVFIVNNGKRVAGILVVHEAEFSTSYALYSGSLPVSRMTRANDFLYYHCIKRAVERGMKYFDMGRTSMNNTGLRRFKLKWGAQESVISTYQYPGIMQREHLLFNRRSHNKLIHYFLSKMPSSVLIKAGSIVYPHLG